MITTTRSSQVTWNQGGQERDGKSEAIAGTATYFKRKRLSTPIKTNVLASTIKAPMVAFPLPRLLTLYTKAAIDKPFTWDVPKKDEFKGAFPDLAFGQAPLSFLTLTDKERHLMKAIISRRSGFRETSLRW
ncbi:hypothetical protein Peur_016395 [Populus x canadensis]